MMQAAQWHNFQLWEIYVDALLQCFQLVLLWPVGSGIVVWDKRIFFRGRMLNDAHRAREAQRGVVGGLYAGPEGVWDWDGYMNVYIYVYDIYTLRYLLYMQCT